MVLGIALLLLLLLLFVLKHFNFGLLFHLILLNTLIEVVILLLIDRAQVLHSTDATSVLLNALSSLNGVKSILIDLCVLMPVLLFFIFDYLMMLVMNFGFSFFFDFGILTMLFLFLLDQVAPFAVHIAVHGHPRVPHVLVMNAIVHLVLVLVGPEHTGLVLLIPVLMILLVGLHSVLKIVKLGLSVAINLILHSLCSKMRDIWSNAHFFAKEFINNSNPLLTSLKLV